MTDYERALATQTRDALAPLIHDDACATFSGSHVHKGKAAVEQALLVNDDGRWKLLVGHSSGRAAR